MGIRPWNFTDYDYLPDYEVVKGIRDPKHQTISMVVTSVSGSVTASARSHGGNVVNGPLAPPKNCKYIFSGKHLGR